MRGISFPMMGQTRKMVDWGSCRLGSLPPKVIDPGSGSLLQQASCRTPLLFRQKRLTYAVGARHFRSPRRPEANSEGFPKHNQISFLAGSGCLFPCFDICFSVTPFRESISNPPALFQGFLPQWAPGPPAASNHESNRWGSDPYPCDMMN